MLGPQLLRELPLSADKEQVLRFAQDDNLSADEAEDEIFNTG